jgi:hypothetical protein
MWGPVYRPAHVPLDLGPTYVRGCARARTQTERLFHGREDELNHLLEEMRGYRPCELETPARPKASHWMRGVIPVLILCAALFIFWSL